MPAQNRSPGRKPGMWPVLAARLDPRVVQRVRDRAINRAAQLLGPMLIVADGTLRSLRKVHHGEE